MALGGRGARPRALAPALLALLLLSSGLALLAAPLPRIGPSAVIGPGSSAPVAAVRPAQAPAAPASCNPAIASFNALYGAVLLPPAVTTQNASACVLGVDEEGVALRSNASLSAQRFEITVALPPLGASPATVLQQFFLSVPVRGIGCSYGGQSLLRIDLAPPGAPAGVSGGWALRAPVWDLASPGACDPKCQNTSAMFPVGGEPFCLDDAVVKGVGSPGFSPLPVFAPGDVVRFTVTNGNGRGLTVYANDTPHAILSTSWNYSAGTVVGGAPVEPWSSVASGTGGWSFGGSPGYGWTNCPIVNATGLAGCDSYDPPAATGLATPSVTNATFWNSTSSTYTRPYATDVLWSSTGACSGTAGLTHCLDFASNGGAGAYPGLHVAVAGGRAWVSYGANRTDVLGPLGGATFSGNGTAAPLDPVTLSSPSASVNNTTIVLSARASDPRGIGLVQFSAVWCFGGGSSTSPSALTVNGVKGAGTQNGSEDAFWTASFPRGNNITGGTLYYQAVEYTNPRDSGSLPLYAQATIASSGLNCGAITVPPPIVIAANSTANGYNVTWFFPPISEPEVVNYTITVTPAAGAPTLFVIPNPRAAEARLNGLLGATAYSVNIAAGLVDGRMGPSNPVAFPASPTLGPLSASLSGNATGRWQPNTAVGLSASVTGGVGPYDFRFSFGDGSTAWLNRTPVSSVTQNTSYPGYLGHANITVTVYDRAGDAATSATWWVWVNGTPGGVDLSLSAGDDNVALRWAAPYSPTGPVTRYEIFYSQSATALETLTAAWPTNSSGPTPVYLWNTSRTYFNFSAIDGFTVYADVIAWNALGGGFAARAGPSEGVPAIFGLQSFGPSPGSDYGGAAPYNASFSASTTGGTNDPLVGANFTVTELSPTPNLPIEAVSANLTSSSGPGGTGSWANASISIGVTGVFLLQVHLTDARSDPELIPPGLHLYVGTGGPPTVTATVETQFAFAGHPVVLNASAGGTSGPYRYVWEFGDGTRVNVSNPEVRHTYLGSGTFMASVTATDQMTGGSATADVEFNVYATPFVRIVASEGTAGSLSYLFQAVETGGSGAPRGLLWAFGDGTSGTGQNATHTFAKAGQYTVSVSLTDPAGPNATSAETIYAGVAATAPQSNADYLAAVFVLLLGVVALAALTVYFYWRSKERPPELPSTPSYPSRSVAAPAPEPAKTSEPPPDEPPE